MCAHNKDYPSDDTSHDAVYARRELTTTVMMSEIATNVEQDDIDRLYRDVILRSNPDISMTASS